MYASNQPPLSISSRNRDFHLHACLNVDNDLLDHFGWRIQVNEALVNPHLEHIPRLTTFTTGCLACRNLEVFRWQADGAFDAEVLGFSAVNQL